MKRKATAVWKGTGLEGKGSLTTKSGVFKDQPYSFKTRFENEEHKMGTNPEELIAAAHAGCFCMALSFALTGAGHPPAELACEATVRLEKQTEGFAIEEIVLDLKASVPGIGKDKFEELAKKAKDTCPISMALSSVDIVLKTSLNS